MHVTCQLCTLVFTSTTTACRMSFHVPCSVLVLPVTCQLCTLFGISTTTACHMSHHVPFSVQVLLGTCHLCFMFGSSTGCHPVTYVLHLVRLTLTRESEYLLKMHDIQSFMLQKTGKLKKTSNPQLMCLLVKNTYIKILF
jgi:hypothetical protein